VDDEEQDDIGLGLIGTGSTFQKTGILKKTIAKQKRLNP